MKKICFFILAMFAVLSASATDYYLIGQFNEWNPSANKFTQTTDGSYEITIPDLKGEVKVLTDGNWDGTQYGAVTSGDAVTLRGTYTLQQGETNLKVGRDGFAYSNATFKLQVNDGTHTLTFVSGTEYASDKTYQIVGGYNSWSLETAVQFEPVNGVLTAEVPNLSGEFKVVSERSWNEQWATNRSTNAKLEFGEAYVMSGKEGNTDPANLSLANPFGGYTNAKLTLQVGEDGTMTLTLIDGTVNRTEADWYMPGEVLGWDCTDAQKLSPVEGEDNIYQITIPNFGDRFKFVYGNWLLQFGATGDQKWQLNQEYTCSLTESDIHAVDDAVRYTNCTVTLVVDYENAVVKFTVASEDTGEPTSLQQTEVEPVATKIIENGQVLIIKDGVRYNMMGVKVD